MIRDYTTIKMTEEDKKYLSFLELYPGERHNLIGNARRVELRRMIICGVITAILSIIAILLNKETQVLAWILFSSSSIFSGFWFIAQIYLSIRNIKSVKYKNIRKIEVIKIGTLPKEFETVYRVEGANDTLEFYPIICRDAHTNYETKLYVSKEDYKRPIGAIITRYLDPYND